MVLIGSIILFKFHQHGLTRDWLGDHFAKKRSRETNLPGICGKVMVLIGAIIFQTFTNIVWQGIALGTMFVKVRRVMKTLIMNMWKSDGPNRGHHFQNFD